MKGRVQRAGYRDTIDRFAYEHDLTGFVQNLEDGTVEIVCEGDKTEIEKFIEEIEIVKYPIKVTDVIVEYSEATGEFEYFDIVREEDFTKAVYERMDIAAEYLGNIYSETKKVHDVTNKVYEETKIVGTKVDEVGTKVDEVGTKVDEVGTKVDEVGTKVDEVGTKVDEVGTKVDEVGTKVDEGFADVKVELGGKLDNISEKMDRSITHTEKFHNETVEKFDYLDVKYGEFSNTLNKLLNKFDVLEGDIREMKDAFIKLVDHLTS